MIRVASRAAGWGVVACLLVAVDASPARAGEIELSPIRLTLSAAAPIGIISVTNRGTEPAVMQGQIFEWRQQQGGDVLSPTRDVLVNPAIFRVDADGRQIVRFGLERRDQAAGERAYRIVFQEVPQRKQAKAGEIATLLRFSVPIFVPAAGAAADLRWTASLSPAGDGIVLSVSNAGNAHVQITALTVTTDSGQPVAARALSAYVLQAQAATWLLPSPAAVRAGQPLRIVAETDGGRMQARVSVLAPSHGNVAP